MAPSPAEHLLLSYARRADQKSVESAVELFTEDAIVEFAGSEIAGRAAIGAHYSRTWAGGSAHRHVITNILPASDGKSASALYQRIAFDPNPRTTTYGEYEILVEGSPAGWLIKHLRVIKNWHVD